MTAAKNIRVLFVEDDRTLREATVQGLELEGYQVDAFGDAAAASRILDAEYPGVIVSDVRLPGMDGLKFFEQVKRVDAEIPLIFTTGHGDVAMAVEAMKSGAADYLTKPYAGADLFSAIKRAAEKRFLVIENRKLRLELSNRETPRVLGSSDAAESLCRMVEEIAAADIDLMIAGESGTGKNFVARQIHDLSPRHRRPFATIDVGIATHEDAELLMFGRAPGTGRSRSGIFERVSGGTVLLDEIESFPGTIQARLLGVVENRSILPIGADRPQPINIRIISATRYIGGAPPENAGAIATQLFYRLAGLSIKLPNLNERRNDIPEIFRYFVTAYEREFGVQANPISEVEWHYLTSHDWSGNIRELRAFACNFVLGLSQFISISSESSPNSSLKDMLTRFERTVLEDVLRQNDGRVMDVARVLKIQRKTLYDKLSKYGLKPATFRAGRAEQK